MREATEAEREAELLREWRAKALSVIKNCPLGFFNHKLVRHRSTADERVVEWLEELFSLEEA